jgi:hypothetical protein
VKPYLQHAEPESIVVMWETDVLDSSYVIWGLTTTFGDTTFSTSEQSSGTAQIHTAILTNLQPDTKYYYQIVGNSFSSDEYNFLTPAIQSDEKSITIAAMSDMQQDAANPDKFHDIVHDGIIKYFEDQFSTDINENLSMILIPGDLVSTGTNYAQWKNTFFDPADPLFGFVPIYPVLGNHEANTDYFFKYFHLPENGSATYKEHWWTRVESNVRIIGMDSNPGYRLQIQLDWLDSVLNVTSTDPNIDFVFAQLHHPHKSELWLPGEISYTGDVIQLMETFTDNSGKPSIHFFGHTHGYSRGQSRDHNHLWVNVATAGGNIDYWGEYPQNDYDEFTISQDEYGFVLLEIDAGSNPKFVLKRFSLGDESIIKDNTLEDSIQIRINNISPAKPTALYPTENDTVIPDCVFLKANEFIDTDGDGHGASHWQIANNCKDFTSPEYESWKQNENWYFENDLQAGDDLSDEKVEVLQSNQSYCWRVRYRDKSLAWSEWSDPVSFQTSSSNYTDNLLLNPGAEEDTSFWIVDYGELESLEDGECNGISPHTGQKYFAVGAVCIENEFAAAHQTVDLNNFSTEIDAGNVILKYGAYLSNWGGSDIPSFTVQFFDTNDSLILGTDTSSTTNSTWTLMNKIWAIPTGTRSVSFIIMGQRITGTDNDSYFDDIFLQLNLQGDSCSYYISQSTDIETYSNILLNLKLYPNPVSNTAILNIPYEKNKNLQILIFDSKGRKVKSYNHSSPSTFVFYKENLINGLYLLQVSENENILGHVKFIIQD